MSEFNVGDKVYLEGKINDYDENDNTYCVDYLDYRKETHSTVWVKGAVLHSADEFYDKGLNDGWELARKIILPSHMGGYTPDEFKNIFGKDTYISAMRDFTSQEALAKVKEYEERNEIKVGDVVKLKGYPVECEGIVTRVTETKIFRLFRDGSCNYISVKEVFENYEKTGHFDSIDEFMRSTDD